MFLRSWGVGRRGGRLGDVAWNFATNHGQSDRDHEWLRGVKREGGVCQGIRVCGGDGQKEEGRREMREEC